MVTVHEDVHNNHSFAAGLVMDFKTQSDTEPFRIYNINHTSVRILMELHTNLTHPAQHRTRVFTVLKSYEIKVKERRDD